MSRPVVSIEDARPTVSHGPGPGPRAGCVKDLRVDGWLVQPTLNLLSRDEIKVRVRAQLMDLLVCMASRPGKVFRKDELLAEVWDGRWIAESALSRCIAELRAALGDDARRPHVIETITKRGYRLIAPVEAVAEAAQPSFAPATSSMDETADVSEPGPDTAAPSLWQRLRLSARRSA